MKYSLPPQTLAELHSFASPTAPSPATSRTLSITGHSRGKHGLNPLQKQFLHFAPCNLLQSTFVPRIIRESTVGRFLWWF